MGKRARVSWLGQLTVFLVFIILEAVAFHMVKNNAPLQRTWAAKTAHTLTGTIWNSSQNLRGYFSLRTENQLLAQENAALEKELLEARAALQSIRGAFSVVNLDEPGFSIMPAEVVRASNGSQHNYFILNKGYEDGLKEQSGVVTRCGVVGIVDAVSAHYAYGLSFRNCDISISARLGKEGSGGLLVWDGVSTSGAILKEIPLQVKYNPGDTVYTSGHSLLFPPDIPLGVAVDSRIVNGSTNEIRVNLFQDFSAVRYVTVVHNDSFDEIGGLEL